MSTDKTKICTYLIAASKTSMAPGPSYSTIRGVRSFLTTSENPKSLL